MTIERVPAFFAKGIMTTFTFGFVIWYIIMKWMALRLGAP
jgi:tetrahydromethanopterin S-methyltransferase subunit B